MSASCPICKANEIQEIYSGPIRIGTFGNNSTEDHAVNGCKNCQSQWLVSGGEPAEYYDSEVYMHEFDAGKTLSEYYNVHDGPQLKHLNWAKTDNIRGKKIADFGCGAGAFLDFVQGPAKETVGIDINEIFVKEMQAKGHFAYQDLDQAARTHKGRMDLICAFSVIEHLENPMMILNGLRALAHQESRLLISTPNANDFMLSQNIPNYPAFFYRKVHLWYFTATALTKILEDCGWKVQKTHYLQRFGLANFNAWKKEGKPTGAMDADSVSIVESETWRAERCEEGTADYFCLEATLA